MKIYINNNILELTIGDITKLKKDAIVNAANGSLLGGGGVDGAIHKKAGPQLLQECKQIRKNKLGGQLLKTGDAVITNGYNLPAKYVIHTVGPVWEEENGNEEMLLENCYKNTLKLAQQYKLNDIAFPSISTGVFRYPIHLASIVALRTIINFLQQTENKKVTISLFSNDDYNIYEHTLKKLNEKYL